MSSIPPSSSTSFVIVVNGSPGSSSIDAAGDQDWWRVNLTAGTTYNFRLNHSASSSLDPILRLISSMGLQVSSDDDGGGNGNSSITFTPETSGTYYLSAQGYGSTTGAYSLSATSGSSSGGGSSGNTTPLPTLSIAATSADKPEGNTGATPFTFTVTRAGDSSGTSTVSWAAQAGTASAAALDFVNDASHPLSGTLSFAANETSKLITVYVQGDTTVEQDEVFSVQIVNPLGASLSSLSMATATIRNDDGTVPTDTIPPTLTSSLPANGDSSVGASSNIVLTFSETVLAGTGSITITNLTTGGARTIKVSDTTQIAITGRMITINPTTALSNGSQFRLTLSADAVKDTAGNSFAASTNTGITFYTPSSMVRPVASDWGLSQADNNVVGTYAGVRYSYGLHPGEDWNWGRGYADIGRPVVAMADGEIYAVRDLGQRGYGVAVRSTIDNHYVYGVYLHVSNLVPGLTINDKVGRGQEIATLFDTSSMDMGSHLHFELRDSLPDDWYGHDNGNGYYTDNGRERQVSPEAGRWSRESAYANMRADGILLSEIKNSQGQHIQWNPIQPREYIDARAALPTERTSGDVRAQAFNLGELGATGQKIERYDWVGRSIDDNDYYKIRVSQSGWFVVGFADSTLGGLTTRLEDNSGRELVSGTVTDSTLAVRVTQPTDLYIKVTGTDTGSRYALTATLGDYFQGTNGRDTFRFASPNGCVAAIANFMAGDTLQINASTFGLNSAEPVTLRTGATMPDVSGAMAQFLYNNSNGQLSFDRDGTGNSYAAVPVATLMNRPTSLTPSDFQILAS